MGQDMKSHPIVLCGKQFMMTSSNGNFFCVTGPLCGEFTGPGEFPTQRPVTRSFDVFFDLRLNKPLRKHSWGWWFETLSRSLWRHRNDYSFVSWPQRRLKHPVAEVWPCIKITIQRCLETISLLERLFLRAYDDTSVHLTSTSWCCCCVCGFFVCLFVCIFRK